MTGAGFYCIRWDAHYAIEPRPDYLPVVLATADRFDEFGVAALRRLYVETKLLPSRGYVFGYQPPLLPKKMLRPKVQAQMRRTQLRKRMQEKYPLFAEELEQRELQENFEKFSADAIAKKQEELRQMEVFDLSAFEQAMTPVQAIDFLRKQVVLPFVSDWCNHMNALRQKLMRNIERMREAA